MDISMNRINKKVNIKFSAHDAFLEQSSSGSGTLKIDRLESQISLGAIKPQDINRIATIG
jgi:hypothetical protein